MATYSYCNIPQRAAIDRMSKLSCNLTFEWHFVRTLNITFLGVAYDDRIYESQSVDQK